MLKLERLTRRFSAITALEGSLPARYAASWDATSREDDDDADRSRAARARRWRGPLARMSATAVAVASVGSGRRAWLVRERVSWTTSRPARRHCTGAATFGLGWAVGPRAPHRSPRNSPRELVERFHVRRRGRRRVDLPAPGRRGVARRGPGYAGPRARHRRHPGGSGRRLTSRGDSPSRLVRSRSARRRPGRRHA